MSSKRRVQPARSRKGRRAPNPKENSAPGDDPREMDRLLAELENLRDSQGELEHSQQLFAELYDLAPIGYVNLSPEGNIRAANQAALSLLGIPKSLRPGIPFRSFVCLPDQPKFYQHLALCGKRSGGDIST